MGKLQRLLKSIAREGTIPVDRVSGVYVCLLLLVVITSGAVAKALAEGVVGHVPATVIGYVVGIATLGLIILATAKGYLPGPYRIKQWLKRNHHS